MFGDNVESVYKPGVQVAVPSGVKLNSDIQWYGSVELEPMNRRVPVVLCQGADGIIVSNCDVLHSSVSPIEFPNCAQAISRLVATVGTHIALLFERVCDC